MEPRAATGHSRHGRGDRHGGHRLRAGHLRVGLEDAPFGTSATNLALVEEAVRMVRDNGAEPASPAEMRQALAQSA
jgi:uncharacterized protein (DUF849 family)